MLYYVSGYVTNREKHAPRVATAGRSASTATSPRRWRERIEAVSWKLRSFNNIEFPSTVAKARTNKSFPLLTSSDKISAFSPFICRLASLQPPRNGPTEKPIVERFYYCEKRKTFSPFIFAICWRAKKGRKKICRGWENSSCAGCCNYVSLLPATSKPRESRAGANEDERCSLVPQNLNFGLRTATTEYWWADMSDVWVDLVAVCVVVNGKLSRAHLMRFTFFFRFFRRRRRACTVYRVL